MPDSRRKGREAEREVERIIEARQSIEVDRSLGGRKQPRGDLTLPGVCLDAKRQERLSLIKWSREHEDKVPSHLIPGIAYRTNGEPWRVSIPLEDFLDLIEEASN
jgi:hypothetical protein